VLVAGGENTPGNALPSAELYYPAAGSWTNTGSLNYARYWLTSTLLPSGTVLIAGGTNTSGIVATAVVLSIETYRSKVEKENE
jgi:hypothetical protein